MPGRIAAGQADAVDGHAEERQGHHDRDVFEAHADDDQGFEDPADDALLVVPSSA
jgi:hypothetical protein